MATSEKLARLRAIAGSVPPTPATGVSSQPEPPKTGASPLDRLRSIATAKPPQPATPAAEGGDPAISDQIASRLERLSQTPRMGSDTIRPPTVTSPVEPDAVATLPAVRAHPPEISKIPAEREAEFRQWIERHGISDLDHPNSYYDYRGAFLAGVGSEISSVDGLPHWPDTFKRHGHPSFSLESQYSTGPFDGGTWGGPDGETFSPAGSTGAGGTWDEPSQLASGFRSGIEMAKAAGGQMLQAVGSTTGVDRLIELGDELSASAASRASNVAPRIADIRDVASLEDAIDWAAWNIGQGAASSLTPILGAVAGGMAGGPGGAILGAAGPGFALMFGEVRRALEEEGVTDPETLNNWSAMAAIPMAALESVVPGRIGSRLAGEGRREVARSLARRVIGEASSSGVQEGLTEMGQQVIQTGVVSGVADKPIDPVETLWEVLNAGAAGAVGGTAIGAAGGIAPDRAAAPESGLPGGARDESGTVEGLHPDPVPEPAVSPTPAPSFTPTPDPSAGENIPQNIPGIFPEPKPGPISAPQMSEGNRPTPELPEKQGPPKVTVLTGREAGDDVDALPDDQAIPILKERARAHAATLARQVVSSPRLGNVEISGRGLHVTIWKGRRDRALLESVWAIPQLLENAGDVETVRNTDPEEAVSVPFYHYATAPLRLRGTDWTARLVIREATDGRRYYEHSLTRIEPDDPSENTLPEYRIPGGISSEPPGSIEGSNIAGPAPEVESAAPELEPEAGRPDRETAVYHTSRGAARGLSDRALLEQYRAALRNQLIQGAGADEIQGQGARIKRDYADGETAIGTVGTGVGKFERGRMTIANARLTALEDEIGERQGLQLPTVEQAFTEAREREIPKDLRPEFAELRTMDYARLLERLGMAEEAAYSDRGNVLAQVRRALYAGEAERRGFDLQEEDPQPEQSEAIEGDDDLPFDRPEPLAELRKNAERAAARDPSTRRLYEAMRSTSSGGRSGGRFADASPDRLPPRYRAGRTEAPANRPSAPYVETLSSEAQPATVGDRTIQPIRPVEITRLATELLGENKIFLKRYPRAHGAFYPNPKDPKIGLNPDLGRDYQQFAKTLSHEVGHLVDFVSDRDMKRGNILGRLASLKQYLANTIDSVPTDPSRALTPADRRRLRKEAAALSGPRPSDADDLAGWQDEVSERYAELLEQEIEDRGLLTRERIHEELIGVSEWWRPYDKLSAPSSYIAYRESAAELYADALSALLNNPGELQRRAPAFFDAFFAYLERKPDAESAYNSIQELLGRGEEAVMDERLAELRKDFEKGEDILREKEKEKPKQTRWQQFLQVFVDRANPVLKAERARLGKVPAHSVRNAVKLAIQEFNHADNVNRLMLMRLADEVHEPLLEAGLQVEHADDYLMLRRISEGDRGGMAEQAKEAIRDLTGEADWSAARAAYLKLGNQSSADFDPDLLEIAESGVLNPHGYTPDDAKRTLEHLKTKLGDEKYSRLEELMRVYRGILFESVEEAVRIGSYNRAVFEEKILPNKDYYATFAVLDYFNGTIAAGVKGQMGTLKGVGGPYTMTVLKTLTLNRLNEHQRVKQALLGILDVDFPGMAGPAQKVDLHHPEKHAGPKRVNLKYLVDGKLHYREVDDYIAKVIERADIGMLSDIARGFNSITYRVFHPLYVTLSLGWQARNVPRDWKRTFKNLAAAHAGKPSYRQAVEALVDMTRLNSAYFGPEMRAAWRHARRQHVPVIREMLKERALGRAFHSFTPRAEDTKLERMMQEYGILAPADGGPKGIAKKVGRGVETVGVFQETWSKAAAYRVLTERGITGRERAYMVRNYAGTPDSSNRGLGADVPNGIFMYWNVIQAGWRADMEVATQPSTAAGYWFRVFLVDVMPKLAMAAAVIGLFGDDLEEWWEHVPSYDKERYIIVPLPPFYSENELGEKKAVYLRLPHDDVTRVMVASMWSLILSEGPGRVERSVGQVTGEFPGLNPAIDIPLKWIQAASGRNPYDAFRGREVVPRTEWEAGGLRKWKEMARWTLGELGVVSQLPPVSSFTMADPEEGRSTKLESVMRSIAGLSALVKVSDRGLTEARYADEEWETKQRAELRADLSRQVRRATSERHRLNRFGVEQLNPAERQRRVQLNSWYRRYLRDTAAMERARDEGNDAAYDRIRDALNASVPERSR